MKEIVNKVLQKFKDFFGGIWESIFLMIALLLIWYLTGLSLKYSLPVIIFFWAVSEFDGSPKNRKLLASILKIIVVAVLIVSFLITIFPRANKSLVIAGARIDQGVSRVLGSKIDVSAKDRWEIRKDFMSQKFFVYYDSLLMSGNQQEAADTLVGFKRAWDMKVAEDKARKEIADKAQKQLPDTLVKTDLVSDYRPIFDPNRNIATVYPAGEYTLDIKNGEESGWCDIKGCNYTFLEGRTCRFIVTYKDGTTANSWEPGSWPNKFCFKVKSLSDEKPVLKVI